MVSSSSVVPGTELIADVRGRDEAWQREQVASYTSMAEGYRIS